MLKIIFIRHGATLGNLKKRYIGITDEEITEESKILLSQKKYPNVDAIFISPMKRCLQTAQFVYPDKQYQVESDLRECNFGKFENKNYIDLSNNIEYQKWIDSNGTLPFPDGEGHLEFKKRCINAFDKIVCALPKNNLTVAFVIHGGTIMAILEKFSEQSSLFYDWQVENGNGYICTCTYDIENITNKEYKLILEGKLW